MKNKIFLTSLVAVLAVGPALADDPTIIFPYNDTQGDCIGSDINNETTDGSAVNYVANWAPCDCTEGAHVQSGSCDITGVTNNRCQYTFDCESGYTYNGNASGSGESAVASFTTEACGDLKQIEITLDPVRTAGAGDVNGSTTLYTKYSDGVYTNSARTSQYKMTTGANPITPPTWTGHTFKGYFSGTPTNDNCGSGEYIGSTSYITTAGDAAGKGYTSNQTWKACWDTKKYDIVYNSGTCEAKESTDGIYTDANGVVYGGSYTVLGLSGVSSKIVEPTGYHFVDWSETSGGSASSTYYAGNTINTWTNDNNVNLYAICAVDQYNIVYNKGTCGAATNAPNNGVYTDSNAITYGQAYTLLGIDDVSSEIVVPQYKRFIGWSTTSNATAADATSGTWLIDLTDGDTARTLYAVCDDITITLNWNPGSGASSVPTPTYCTYGETDGIDPIAQPTKAGNIFLGWSIASSQSGQ